MPCVFVLGWLRDTKVTSGALRAGHVDGKFTAVSS